MRKWVAVSLAAVVVLAGCGRSVEPKAVAEPPRWDPCSISDSAIETAGFDPTSKSGWGEGIDVPDWALCSFQLPGADHSYVLSVTSSRTHTIEEARQKSTHLDGRNVAVGDRNAFQYKTHVGRTGRSCDIAIELPPGVVVFSVLDMSELPEARLCELVIRHANDLEDSLPAK